MNGLGRAARPGALGPGILGVTREGTRGRAHSSFLQALACADIVARTGFFDLPALLECERNQHRFVNPSLRTVHARTVGGLWVCAFFSWVGLRVGKIRPAS